MVVELKVQPVLLDLRELKVAVEHKVLLVPEEHKEHKELKEHRVLLERVLQ